MFLALPFQQYYSVCADALLASCEAELLGGGGFDGDVVDVDVHYLGERLFHFGYARIHLGTFGADGGIDVAYGVAFGCYDVDGFAKQYLGVDVLEFVAFLGWEMVADVAHIGCSEDGVADSMDENVSVGMAEQSMCVLQFDATEPEVASFNKFVDIVAEADFYFHLFMIKDLSSSFAQQVADAVHVEGKGETKCPHLFFRSCNIKFVKVLYYQKFDA